MSREQDKFNIILELIELGERAFVHKLKMKNPHLSPAEIAAAVRGWYLHRPGAELGDGVGVPGDIKRFDRCDNSSK